MRLIPVAIALAVTLTACGKKEPAAAPATDSGPKKVSVDSAPAEVPPPPPPPVAAAPAAEPAPGAPAPELPEGNWFSKKTVGEKREIMEGWLHRYQAAKGDEKTEIIKQIKNSKLSPADWALLEGLRNDFKYPPLPVK